MGSDDIIPFKERNGWLFRACKQFTALIGADDDGLLDNAGGIQLGKSIGRSIDDRRGHSVLLLGYGTVCQAD
jgi:hypothetical protein